MKQRFAVVDIETTGNSVKNGDRMIQIAIVIMEGEKIVDRFASYVNPLRPIPSFIEQLTSISDDIVQHAPTFDKIAPTIVEKLKGCFFVAHNIHFDLTFLREEFKRVHIPFSHFPVIDTVEMARILYPTIQSYKLADLAETLNINHQHPHRADSDAYVTALLWIELINKLSNVPVETLMQLHTLSNNLISDIKPIIDLLIQERRKDVRSDENITIHHSFAIKKFESLNNRYNHIAKESVPFSQFLSNQGSQKRMKNEPFHYELMANKIFEAFDTNQHCLLEVHGDDVQRIISVFLPVAYHTSVMGKQITIACSTNKRLTTFFHIWDTHFRHHFPEIKIATLKGKQNYLSLANFERFFQEDATNYDVVLTKAQILIWLLETDTGDVDELNLSSGGHRIWERISATHIQTNDSMRKKFCYYNQAVQKAKQAQIVLTNHAMLIADTISGQNHLVNSEYVLVDQANQFEESCRKYFGLNLGYAKIAHELQRAKRYFERHFLDINEMVTKLEEQLDELFRLIHQYVNQKRQNQDLNLFRYRLFQDKEKGPLWRAILELVRKIQFLLLDIIQSMNKSGHSFDKIKSEVRDSFQLNNQNDFHYFLYYWKQLRLLLDYFFFHQTAEEVIWVEIEAKGAKNAVYLYSEPIRISTLLADTFFSKKKSVIQIDQALTIQNTFDYIINRLGLRDFYPMTIRLSPNVEDEMNTTLYVANDKIDQSIRDIHVYTFQLATNIAHIARKIEGKMVVLFSSLEQLKGTYEQIKEIIDKEEYPIFGQGINGSNVSKMVKSLQPFEKGMLFCTAKFWNKIEQGLNMFQTLIVTRLPFSSPNEPIVAANCEQIEREGGNAFYEYSLPEAVLKLKTAIAHFENEKEKKILFILDSRVKTANYGKAFIDSVYVDKMEEDELLKLVPLAKRWLTEE